MRTTRPIKEMAPGPSVVEDAYFAREDRHRIEKLKKAKPKVGEDVETCPVCHLKRVLSCKCFRSDSVCKNGHEWHRCTVHGTIVMGPSDHSTDTMTCTCKTKG